MKTLTKEKMQTLFKSVASDLTNAKLYLNYIDDFDEFFKIKYPQIIGYSYTFWANTIKVYYDAMAMCLIRAYDQNHDNNSVGLKLLLQRIHENNDLFLDNESLDKKSSRSAFQKRLNKDRDYVNHQKNVIVDALRVIRNKSVFHKDEKILYKEAPNFKEIKIDHENIKKLVDEGLDILNYYSQKFNKNTFSTHMVGYGDHEIIFKLLQKHYDDETA